MRFKNGGKIHGKVDNGEKYQIRDLALFSDQDILALGSGARARFLLSRYYFFCSQHFSSVRIFRYIASEGKFIVAYKNESPDSFLNGMDFWEDGKGVAFGDVINGKLLILLTDDFGKTWREAPSENIPEPLDNEIGFAASGTSIVTGTDGRAWIGLGGGPAGIL